MPLEVAVRDACSTIGEGPHWDEASQTLYYVDIEDKSVSRWNSAAGGVQKIKLEKTIGFVIPSKKGDVIIGLGQTIARLEWDTKKITVLHEVDQDKNTRFNDAKCDPRGRIWAGTMGLEKQVAVVEKEQGSLYCIDTDGTIKKHLDKVSISNGLAWSADNKTMYYIDSTPRCVYAFDYDIDTGTPSNQRVIVQLPPDTEKTLGYPDGMAIDSEGKLWVACFYGGRVTRFDPETGKQIQTVEVPGLRTTSLCFGDNTVGFVVPWAKGGVIVGLGKTLTHLDWNTEKTTILHEVDDGLDNRFNDGKCDPRGRIWAGTMGNGKDLALIPKEKGSLYSLDTDGTIKKHVENVTISNGLAWSPDNKTMYYIDSVPGIVYAFDYDIDSGTICRQRPIAEFERGPFGSPFPDGMTIDTDGMLWIACFFGGRVMRMDPKTGKQISAVEMPANRITSCCFGGTQNDELYVTCCVEEDAEKFPLTGSVFKVTGLGVKGLPSYIYTGKCVTTETETIIAETETQGNL